MHKKIIDTHVHIWNFKRASYDWLKNDTSILNRNYELEDFDIVRREAGISEAILVQAANNFEDTNYMLEVAAMNYWVSGVVGWLPLMDPDETLIALQDNYTANKYFKGVRHLIHNEPDAQWLLQENVIESLKILAAYDLPFDVVGILPEHIETALKVSNKIPGLKMVFDHMNQPPIVAKERFGVWGMLMSLAADNPNLYIKISGLGNTCKNNHQWTAGDIKPYIEYVFEKFGTGRCFCGGDWPVSLLAQSFPGTWNIYKDVMNNLLNDTEQEDVFHLNAQKFYQL